MVIQHLFPVFAIIILGAALRHGKFTNTTFLVQSDRLIYYIFFPALLFWKIGGGGQTFSPDSMRFYAAVLLAVAFVYILSIIFILLFRVDEHLSGTFSQSCYRFNTYIGMAVILTVRGETGVAQFGVLIGLAIPFINIMAVSTLIWFSSKSIEWRQRLRMTLSALVTNPLILACAAGIAYAHWIHAFPLFVENTLKLGTMAALPLALLSIGGNLTLKNLRQHFGLTLVGSAFKLIVLPVIGWFFLSKFGVAKMYYPVGMLFFALPTSTAIYVLSAQLKGDTDLASASVVVSTVLSFFSMSAVLWLFQ